MRCWHEGGFGWVAGLERVGNSEQIVRLNHVGVDGVEEDVEGELGQSALALGAEDGMCLFRGSLDVA